MSTSQSHNTKPSTNTFIRPIIEAILMLKGLIWWFNTGDELKVSLCERSANIIEIKRLVSKIAIKPHFKDGIILLSSRFKLILDIAENRGSAFWRVNARTVYVALQSEHDKYKAYCDERQEKQNVPKHQSKRSRDNRYENWKRRERWSFLFA